MTAYPGACHCGAVGVLFETDIAPGDLQVRACQCGFCRAHGARTTSDPNGAIRIKVRDSGKLQRYRFGLKTADFLICRECGAFIGALMEEGGKHWFTVNANSFKPPPAYDIVGAANDFGAEDVSGRVARRTAKWTPVTELSL